MSVGVYVRSAAQQASGRAITHAAEHESPIEASDMWLVRNVIERKVGHSAEHDSERGPYLPALGSC